MLDWRRQPGAEAIARLLELPERPDAVFCFNDLLALGAVRGLRDAGLEVPGDVAVVGFDDIEESRYSTPSLSTVAALTSRGNEPMTGTPSASPISGAE